jgi:hypothetical protein
MSEGFLTEVSRRLLVVELVLTVAFALLVTATAAAARWRERRREARCARGRDMLARAIAPEREGPDGVEALGRLPWAVQRELVLEFGGSLTGAGRARLTSLGVRAGVTARAIALCHSPFWWRRLSGARVLTALDHDCAAMRRLLHDRSAAVRAQALVWAAGRVDQQVIRELVSRLADPARLCRFTVKDSLLRLGRPAAGVLARFLSDPDRPGLADGLAVARGLAQPELLDPALALCSHESAEVRAQATAVLGVLGGERAVERLILQMDDEAAIVRAAAARALGDLGYWQASPALVRLLRDTSWPVRREGALALRRLGGPGLLSLRRALGDENPFAADMARQVLDLPDSVYHRIAS